MLILFYAFVSLSNICHLIYKVDDTTTEQQKEGLVKLSMEKRSQNPERVSVPKS